jgi:hypothetical protein
MWNRHGSCGGKSSDVAAYLFRALQRRRSSSDNDFSGQFEISHTLLLLQSGPTIKDDRNAGEAK